MDFILTDTYYMNTTWMTHIYITVWL